MKEYKVLTQNSSIFGGEGITPEKLEDKLNELAKNGWKLIAVASVEFPAGPFGNRAQVCMFMEKES
jgi:hypothetical protein